MFHPKHALIQYELQNYSLVYHYYHYYYNNLAEGPKEHKMPDWTFRHKASGIPRAQHSLMWGFATLMPSLTGTRSRSRSIASIKTTSDCPWGECWMLSMAHPLEFTTTGGTGKECIRYHSQLAELIADKKEEHYSQTIFWTPARTSSLLQSTLVCLRGSWVKRCSTFDYWNHSWWRSHWCNCLTFMQPVCQFVVPLWSPSMNCPSHHNYPHLSFIVNRGIHDVARLLSHPAATLTDAVCTQAFIGPFPVPTSLPKRAVMNLNIPVILHYLWVVFLG